jgi:hypothetical protein
VQIGEPLELIVGRIQFAGGSSREFSRSIQDVSSPLATSVDFTHCDGWSWRVELLPPKRGFGLENLF